MAVYREKPNAIAGLFGRPKAVIGVIHARPLPGAPAYGGEPVEALYDVAVREAERYAAGGLDGVIVENHGDIPFLRPGDIGPETPTAMAVMADRVRRAVGLPVGIKRPGQCRRPGDRGPPKAAGAAFISGQPVGQRLCRERGESSRGDAAKVTRYRSWLRAQDLKGLRRRPRQARRPRDRRRPHDRGDGARRPNSSTPTC